MATDSRLPAHTAACPSSAAGERTLPAAQSALVELHPCYSQEAHHFYARMHVAVAPRCNIQCKYCNRKFDCVNESRPGVTSSSLAAMPTLQPFLAAVATSGDGVVNEHFGHAREFQVYRVSQDDIQFMTTWKMDEYCSHDSDCAEAVDRLLPVYKLLEDCEYLLCLRIGPDPVERLAKRGITPIMAYGMIEKALYQVALQHAGQSANAGQSPKEVTNA